MENKYNPIDFNNLDNVIKENYLFNNNDTINIIKQAEIIFENEPNIINIDSPVIVIGDIHGDFCSIIQIFKLTNSLENIKFLFLGDIVDKGIFLLPSASGGVVKAAISSAFRAMRASLLDMAIRWVIASGCNAAFNAPTPCNVSFSALMIMTWSSSSVSGFKVRTWQRDNSGDITSKEGFSVVAPMKVTVPSST